MEKQKIKLKDIKYEELLGAYKEVENCLAFLDEQYENVKKLEEENT